FRQTGSCRQAGLEHFPCNLRDFRIPIGAPAAQGRFQSEPGHRGVSRVGLRSHTAGSREGVSGLDKSQVFRRGFSHQNDRQNQPADNQQGCHDKKNADHQIDIRIIRQGERSPPGQSCLQVRMECITSCSLKAASIKIRGGGQPAIVPFPSYQPSLK
ncbi:MAG: hypothetical protein UZ16_OP3001000285, partial [Candidatus Hinthialibacteria bacterium OLB16]